MFRVREYNPYMSYSPNSLKGDYAGENIGEYCRDYEGGY